MLIEKEEMEVGGVKWGVYSYYAYSIGILATLAIIVFYLGFQGFQVRVSIISFLFDHSWKVGSSIWLSQWVDDPAARLKETFDHLPVDNFHNFPSQH